MPLRTILIIATASLPLGGCFITGKTSDGFSIVKPSQKQINDAARRIVCESLYPPPTFDDRYDSQETIAALRRNNAAIRSFGCK